MAKLGRERDLLNPCGEEPWKPTGTSPPPVQEAATSGRRFGVRDITVLDLVPLPTDEEGNLPPDIPPPGGVIFPNQAFWVSLSCSPDGTLVNTLWVLVPCCTHQAYTQTAANAAAAIPYRELLADEINCSPLSCSALGGSSVFQMLPFDQQCAAGYWFSEPVEPSPDGVTINNPNG